MESSTIPTDLWACKDLGEKKTPGFYRGLKLVLLNKKFVLIWVFQIPPPQQLTKWERFSREKGIGKKEKSKKVFDESTETWKTAYGYRRGNDDTKDWMIEIPRQKDPYRDYYGERIEKKKERTSRNEYQQMKNQMRAIKQGRNGDDVNNIPVRLSLFIIYAIIQAFS